MITDDSPDIGRYLGYFEYQGVCNRNKNNGLFFRNTLKEGHRGAIQLDWGFPVHDHLRGYVQYFYGIREVVEHELRKSPASGCITGAIEQDDIGALKTDDPSLPPTVPPFPTT